MPEGTGKAMIAQLRKAWMQKALLTRFVLALAITVFIATAIHKIFSLPFYTAIPLLLFIFLTAVLINQNWRVSEWSVSGFLNRSIPALQESAHLFLKPPQSLNLLEKLQVKKLEQELPSLKAPDPFQKRFAASLLILLIASAGSLVSLSVPSSGSLSTALTNGKAASGLNPVPEKLLPQIKTAAVLISPPAYTGKASRQSGFNIEAEEGALVSWQIQTSVPAKEVKILFNDGTTAPLTADDKHLNWKAQKGLKSSGFYGVKIDSNTSDLYKIEVIKDRPPTITIQSPQPATSVTYGQSETVL